MFQLLIVLWFLSLLLLMIYHLLIFGIREKKASNLVSNDLPGVSIVIAVRNGHHEFMSFLNRMLEQDYPLFEIIIMDDHSDPGMLDELNAFVQQHSQIRLIQSTDKPGKKNALVQGIQQASFPMILCTDSDCYPKTSKWISGMVRHADLNTVVLSYSPYQKQKGLLNLWIRFETLITGMQYLSWASLGKPYMGVGRNLLFPRKWFLYAQPFSEVMHIPYGDDDLLVQRASAQLNIVSSINEETFVYSQAATDWTTWWRQKHRHMSAGHHYQASSWLKPGLMGVALTGHWFIFPLVWHQMYPGLLICFITALILRWIRYVTWTQKLGERDTIPFYPLLEAAYALYLAVMGVYTLFNRKKTWS